MRIFSLVFIASCSPATPSASDGLLWLQGTWQQRQEQVVTEERWALQSDGSLLGSGRVLISDRMGFAETLSIIRGPGGLIYTAWPAGQEPVQFRQRSRETQSITFANDTQTFPKAVTYELTDPVSITVTAEGQGDQGPRTDTWTLTLVPGSR